MKSQNNNQNSEQDKKAKPLSLEEKKLALKKKIEDEAKVNFDSFVVYLKKSRSDCILMLKNWISKNDQLITDALVAVAQQLPANHLAEIFKDLNPDERDKWKSKLKDFLAGKKLVDTNKFISEEVARAKISPNSIKDVKLVDMLLKLSLPVAKEFIVAHIDQAAILLNLVTPEFSAKLLDSFEPEKAEELIGKSLSFDFDQIKDNYAGFKSKLEKFIEVKRKKPFNFQLLKILPTFNPLKEKMLYELLAKEQLGDEIKNMATENLPSELVYFLPKELLKVMMQNYPMNKKVELLMSLEEENKNKLMSSFAETGSASREMLDLEFENLKADPNASTRILGQKERIWREFITYVRAEIKGQAEFKSDIESLVGDWITDLISKVSSAA